MLKKIFVNVVLLFTTYVVPLYLLYTFQDSAIKIGKIQTPALSVLFFGSVLLTYLNNKYRKQAQNHKWLWVIFQIIGVLGLCFSAVILFILFLYRNCCGF